MTRPLSIVIPTFNEAENIGVLLRDLQREFEGLDVEYIVVDDDSEDGTAAAAHSVSPAVKVVVRREEKGLGTAVIRGFEEAQGDLVAVMDADLQHPPSAVRAMYEKATTKNSDMVIGSRHIPGGSAGAFGKGRAFVSWTAATMAKIALPTVRQSKITDPMSGLFLVKRSQVVGHELRPRGYKIMLEILTQCPIRRVHEVPYQFQTRHAGDSKMGAGNVLLYLVHLLGMAAREAENRRIAMFLLVGLSGVAVNLGILTLLVEVAGWPKIAAAAVSVEASIISNFLLDDAITFRNIRHGSKWVRWLKFNTISLVALTVNLTTFSLLLFLTGLHYQVAELIAVTVAFAINYLVNVGWTYRRIIKINLNQ